MADWGAQFTYDYRFGALVIQAKRGDETSPPWHVNIADLLRKIPAYELRELMNIAATTPPAPLLDLEVMRRKPLFETDWNGRTCLDLAGYDGFAAKIAMERGAKSAKVVDSEQWRIYGWKQPDPIPGVEFIKSDLYDWQEPADIVVWYNCLYHVPDPMRALRHVRSLTKEAMLLCTLVRYHDGAWVYLYAPRECNETDPSVYWGPSVTALERMLELTGWTYQQVGLTGDRTVYVCKPIPDFVDAETEEIRRASKNGG